MDADLLWSLLCPACQQRLQYGSADATLPMIHPTRPAERAALDVLSLLAEGAPLPLILETIVLRIEQANRDVWCSILLLDEEGKRLRHGAAPSLPTFYPTRRKTSLFIAGISGANGNAVLGFCVVVLS